MWTYADAQYTKVHPAKSRSCLFSLKEQATIDLFALHTAHVQLAAIRFSGAMYKLIVSSTKDDVLAAPELPRWQRAVAALRRPPLWRHLKPSQSALFAMSDALHPRAGEGDGISTQAV